MIKDQSPPSLAAQAGLSEDYVSQIETGKCDGTVNAFKCIAGVLGVSVDDLV